MKKTILIGALALALGACSKEVKENSNVIQVDIENAQPMNLADFVESIKLVPLETTDESLIKQIRRMVMQDGKVYIQNDLQNVLVFDENGKFLLSTAKRLGQGPEDYFMMTSMDITDDGLISIYEGLRIREYDMDLKLVNSYFPQMPDSIRNSQEMRKHIKLDDDTYLFRDYQYTSLYSASKDSVLSIKHEYYHPYSHTGNVNSLRFLKHQGGIYFSPTFICDTLYRVNQQTRCMEPVVIYDAGDTDVNLDDIAKDMPAQYYFEFMFHTDKPFLCDKIHLANADICFWTNIKKGEYGVTYRNRKGDVTTYKNGEETLPTPHTAYEGKLVYASMPDDVEKHIIPKLVDAESLKRIKDLKEDDNQVLVIYTLK